MPGFADIREECLAANPAPPRTDLVDLTFGNVSVADPQRRVFTIKPSGMDYDRLTPQDMVILDCDGIRSVVHTHSRDVGAFARAGKTLIVHAGVVDAPAHLLDKHFFRKHGAGAYYAQPGTNSPF